MNTIVLRTALMTLVMLLAPLTMAIHSVTAERPNYGLVLLAAAWIVATVSAMGQIAALLLNRDALVETERALYRASASLVVSSDLQSRYRSAVSATLEVLGDQGETAAVSIAIVRSTGWQVVADDRTLNGEEIPNLLIPSKVMEKYLAGDVVSTRNIARNLHGARHFKQDRGLAHFLLSAQGGIAGGIFVSTRNEMSVPTRNALMALASSISLAFEAAALNDNLMQRRSEAQFRSLVEKSSDIIMVINQHGKATFVSPVGEEILGQAGSNLEELLRRLPREDQLAVLNLVNRTKEDTGVENVEFKITHNNKELWFEASANNLLDDKKVQGVVLNARNISERRTLENDLRFKVLHDSLTGIANRTLFRDRLDHALKMRARNPETKIAVLFIDLDDFKTVNDGLGHDAGDELLKVVAFRLESHVRAQDTAARLGGDEFAVLLEGLDSIEMVMEASNRIMNALKADVEFGDRSMTVGASIGVAIAETDVTSDALLRNADVAMYEAKRSGKNRVVPFDQSMYVSAVERLELKSDVVHATGKGELALHYQPLVRLSDSKLLGFEALLRWDHPTLGFISPDSFIPLAEETGSILEMGAWVLLEACMQVKGWQDSHGVDIGININVSPRQLADDRIIEDVQIALEKSGINPEKVTLEITEGEGLEDTESRRRLIALRSLGCRVAADDFGTGFASYAALQQLPFTDVKIDRSLIKGLSDGDPRARAQVGSIIQMGHALGLSITAEGIEDSRQADALIAMKTDKGQGYLIGRPATATQAVEHFAATPEILPSWW